MRAAIFGGTFNPIHNAHITVARAALAHFNLDAVLIVPAANPPHKSDSDAPAFEHRYRMVELACAGIPGLRPSRIEEHTERSFSILTIERLKAEQPQDQFFFLIGADAFAEIKTWFRWQDVLREIDFIVAARPGHTFDSPSGARVHRLDTVDLPVSSSAVRGMLAQGRQPPDLAPAVAAYIRQNHLYGLP